MQTTSNYGLKKPDGTDTVDIADLNYNADQIDSALTPTADPAQAPTGNGPGKLVQWVGWLINRIKAITGKANWWDAPTKSMEQINTDLAAHLADYMLQVPYGGVTTNAGNDYSVATPAIASLIDGMAISVKINTASTGAATLNWSGRGAKSILKPNGAAATVLKTNSVYTLRYNGTNFILQGEGSSGTAIASDLLSGKTAGSDAGDITGTMPDNAGDVNAVSYHVSGTSLHVVPAHGHADGVDDAAVITDADFVTGNIKAGVNIFGVAGNSNVVDTSPGNAVAADILAPKIAFVAGVQLTGTFVDRGQLYCTTFSTSSLTEVDVLNLSGKGFLSLAAATASVNNIPVHFRIIVDGVDMGDISTMPSSGGYTFYSPFKTTETPLCIEFKNSLRITGYVGIAATATYKVAYSLNSSGGQFHCTNFTTSSQVGVDALNISGKGFLSFAFANSTTTNFPRHFQVIADGVDLGDEYVTGGSTYLALCPFKCSNSPICIEFKNSLRIIVYVGGTGADSSTYRVAYSLDA